MKYIEKAKNMKLTLTFLCNEYFSTWLFFIENKSLKTIRDVNESN